MSFEDKLKQKVSEQIEYEKLDNLPEMFLAKILGEPKFKADKKENECLYLTLAFPNGKGITQKYTKTLWKELQEAIKEAGGLSDLMNRNHVWERREVGTQTRFDRYYPTKETELKEP